MMYFKATFANSRSVFFDAKDGDAALEYGNMKANKQATTMVALTILSKKEAHARGLDVDETK